MAHAKGCRVLFLRSNPIDPDPRVEKEARALRRAGFAVNVLGWDRTASLPSREEKEFGVVQRIPMLAKFGSGLANLPYLLRFQVALLRYLWRHRREYDILHACDFDTLIPALLMKAIFRKRVVYDIFDFYADMLLKVPNWIRSLVRFLDLKLMGLADAVILADESRVEQIKGGRARRLAFVYNVPELRETFPPLPPSPPPYRIGYVGLLSTTRGILEVIEVVSKRQDWVMELAGFGGDEETILSVVKQFPNIRFHGRVPYEEGLAISASSHVLFATYDPRVPNHRFSSANKLFEAMALGRPIIVARGTGMDHIVAQYGLGYIVDYGALDQLEWVLRDIETWDVRKWEEFSAHTRGVYGKVFSWEKQTDRLIAVYRELSAC